MGKGESPAGEQSSIGHEGVSVRQLAAELGTSQWMIATITAAERTDAKEVAV